MVFFFFAFEYDSSVSELKEKLIFQKCFQIQKSHFRFVWNHFYFCLRVASNFEKHGFLQEKQIILLLI